MTLMYLKIFIYSFSFNLISASKTLTVLFLDSSCTKKKYFNVAHVVIFMCVLHCLMLAF